MPTHEYVHFSACALMMIKDRIRQLIEKKKSAHAYHKQTLESLHCSRRKTFCIASGGVFVRMKAPVW